MNLDRLRVHGVLDLIEAVAQRHGCAIDSLTPGALADALDGLRARGWSQFNADRLLGFTRSTQPPPPPPPMPLAPRRVTGTKPTRAIPPAPRDSTPGSPLRLPLLAIDDLTVPTERFRCVPFAATIPASTCVARQVAGRSPSKVGSRDAVSRWVFIRCRNCPDGTRVAARLGAALPKIQERFA